MEYVNKYCENCGKETETKIVIKKEIYEVCGESIEVHARVLTCVECDEEFYCEELDNETLVAAYNEYRRKHKLLFAEDIKKIRESYGLSQRSFAKLLNWGDKTIRRYVHLPYGPVMENFDILFGKMAADNIARINIICENRYEKHQVVPESQFPKGVLSLSEIAVLERVYNKFFNFGSIEISNYSHAEKGYSSTTQGEIISYLFTKDMYLK